jgi:copper chaperone CopZ
MTTTLYIDNIKCGGCASTIEKKLNSMDDIQDIHVDVAEGKVTFESLEEEAKAEVLSALKKLGYPERGTGTGLDNAKSYVSCMIGKIDNKLK